MNKIDKSLRRGRKYDQVMSGARKVFLSAGYDGANVDDIAREAGVSKATMYSYFPTKEALFVQVAAAECRRQADSVSAEIDPNAPVADVLTLAAQQLMSFNLSDFGQSNFRIIVGEAERFPELGRLYYESGPARVKDLLVSYFRHAGSRGELNILEDELELAAYQFLELCKAELFPKLVFQVEKKLTNEQRNIVRDAAVSTFLARFGKR